MDPTEQLEAIHRIAKQQVAERLRAIIGLAEQKAINSVPKVDINLPPIFAPLDNFLWGPARYAIMYGGRGSGKSWTVARWLLREGTKKKLRILCTREFQNSIAESVHLLLSDQIKELGLESFYRVTDTYIEGANGTTFLFRGLLRNTHGIKSFEGVDICWIEEAEKVSEPSWKFLGPTIRKKGSKIIVTFNPAMETDPTYVRLIKNTPTGSILIKANWRDNPHFTDELRFEMETDRARDLDGYMHVWEGECATRSAAQIFDGKCRVADFEAPAGVTFYHGCDFGFAADPTTAIRCYIHDERLWIDYEVYRHRLEIDHTAQAFIDVIPRISDFPIRCDSARPESISYLTRHGLPKAEGVEKWPESVADGITILRGFKEIVIHIRCRYTQQEARLYSYKVDKHTQDILPDVEDKHNHIWDAVRYALAPIIRRSTAKDGMLQFYKMLAEQAEAKKNAGQPEA